MSTQRVGWGTVVLVCALAGGSAQAKDVLIDAGDRFTCAWFSNNQVKCWGDNLVGQLGQGDTSGRGDAAGEMGAALLAIDLGDAPRSITVGSLHACAVLDSDEVKCWGYNGKGQLGLGDINNRGDAAGEMGAVLDPVDLGTDPTSGLPFTAKFLAAGAVHSCAVLDNNDVKCWGNNLYGQLGLGDNSDRGDAAGEMGGVLPRVKLGHGRTAKGIATGAYHSCALLDNDTIKCWGNNAYGQLGQGDADHRGNGPGEMAQNLAAIDVGTGRTAVKLAAGSYHTCAILDDGSVKCWGRNDEGQLGLGDNVDRGDGANEMGDFLPTVALGTGRTATGIAAAGDHTCVILDDGSVKCWGYNQYGQLGLGDMLDRGDGPNEMGDLLPAVSLGTGRTAVRITAGLEHACAVLDTNEVKCWGHNNFGQLGLGDNVSRGDSAGEMGDLLPAIDLGP